MEEIEKAVEVLNSGGIIIFPTDTAFGIGCRIDKKESIEKLFTIRRRPVDKATPVLVSSIEMVKDYVHQIPDEVKSSLIDKYWPGALTIILEAKHVGKVRKSPVCAPLINPRGYPNHDPGKAP